MRNIIRSWNNRGPYLQKRLWRVARANSLYKSDGGADPFGWTVAATKEGFGRYALVGTLTLGDAIAIAARGIATTGRPAGIVVWHGTHAWLMTGFEATADPRATADYQIVSVRIADPLWPYFRAHGHRVYRPGTRLYMRSLAQNFTRYHDGRRDPRIEGRYVTIVPLADGAAVPDGAWTPSPIATPAPTASPAIPSPTSTPDTGAPVSEPTTSPSPTPEPTASPTSEPSVGPSPGDSATASP
jgi:cell division septation protein DedD